jgi:uncharacterized Zn-binding protein involved in type VI secretion
LICGHPAARAGDIASSWTQILTGHLPSNVPIVVGSPTVLIGGKPAARSGDATASGDQIVVGCPTVVIGP